MGTISMIPEKYFTLLTAVPQGMYIQVIFSAIDLASWPQLSEPAPEDPDPGRSTHRKLATTCMREPEGLFAEPRGNLSHLMPALLPPVGKRDQLTWTTALGIHPS
jgi:hypothetical protein